MKKLGRGFGFFDKKRIPAVKSISGFCQDRGKNSVYN
jgi:hypothetical protein